MHIFVTGGTGFFGKALLRKWPTDMRLTLLSRNPEHFRANHGDLIEKGEIRLIQGNVLTPSTLPSGDYTHILHAATDSTFGPKLCPLERYVQIVEGTRNLLDFAVKHEVPRFLLTSSGGVYGSQPHDMLNIPENYHGMPDPLNPQNTYSVAKRCAEHLCSLYREHHGLDTVIARCFAFVGRDLPLNVHFAIGNFIHDALMSDEIIVRGDGTPIRSYMDQRDLANWLITLLLKGKGGQAYNIGSSVGITISDLAALVRNILAPGKPIKISGNSTANTYRNRYVPSTAKAQEEFGLDLSYSLEESIKEVAKYALAQ